MATLSPLPSRSTSGSGSSTNPTSTTSSPVTDRRSSSSWVASPPTPTGGQSQTARNPVSLRLYKVLSTRFDDEDTKKALDTLSEMYGTPDSSSGTASAAGPTPTTATSIKRLSFDDANDDTDGLGSGGTNTGTGSSGGGLGIVGGSAASKARKNLRRDMENKLAEGSRMFLGVLEEVDMKLKAVQEHVAAMRIACDEAETQLALTGESSKMLLERAGNLRDERQEIETKKTIIALFLSRFTLSDDESSAITSRDVPVGARFFEAMDKSERIRDDCRVLMSAEDGDSGEPSRAGLDIMVSTSSYLEQAYDKILRFCSNEFRTVGRDVSQVEVSPILKAAVKRLRKRPELLTEALTHLSETRQSTLLSSFLTALTRGGPSGFPRPIELHAHDPLRYVGDMLAWVHQSIAAEREFLESLFGMQEDKRMVGSVRKFDAVDDADRKEEEEWMKELMDLAVSKLCGPLKNRVQQTIKSQESSIVLYKIANLLQFYRVTMYRTIGEDALLSTALKEITEVSYKVFYDSIENQSKALYRVPLDIDDPSLTPPLSVLDHMQILREVMSVYQSSLLGDEDEEERNAGFSRVLDIMINPLVELCISNSMAKKKSRPKWDDAVFVLNCLSYLQNVLSGFNFTTEKQKGIQTLIDQRVSLLTTEHAFDLMRDAGLLNLVEACKNHRTSEPLSRIPATNASEVQRALQAFSRWLSGPSVVDSPRLGHLSAQGLYQTIHQDALKKVGEAYGTICENVKDPANRYEAGATLVGSERPFGQMELLWQIFGV